MINRDSELSITRQAELLGFSRGMVYYEPKAFNESDLKRMHASTNYTWTSRLWVRVCYATNWIEKTSMLAVSMGI